MNTDVKLPYGLYEGKLISINAVSSGLACGCFCPKCKQTLVAKKGEIKTHHFAHHNAVPCEFAVETAIHMLAKQILDEAKRIKLPAHEIKTWPLNQIVSIHKERWVDIDKVYSEKRFRSIVPDIVVQSGAHKLYVEVFVNNFARKTTLEKIRKAKVSCLEINISKLRDLQDIALIKKKILEDVDLKKWVYSEKAGRKKQHIKQHIAQQKDKRFDGLKIDIVKKESLRPKKRVAQVSKVCSWTDKTYKCTECGKETRDWFKCDTGKMTCVCRDCHYKS